LYTTHVHYMVQCLSSLDVENLKRLLQRAKFLKVLS
jgi:hypothetical protein